MKRICIVLLCLTVALSIISCSKAAPVSQIPEDASGLGTTSPTEVERLFKESLYNYFKTRPQESGAILKLLPFAADNISPTAALEISVATLRDDIKAQLDNNSITKAEYETKINNFTTAEINRAAVRCLGYELTEFNTDISKINENGDVEVESIEYDPNYRMNTKSITENSDNSLTAEIDVQIVDEDSSWNNSSIEIIPDSECKHRYITIVFDYNSSDGMFLTYRSITEKK